MRAINQNRKCIVFVITVLYCITTTQVFGINDENKASSLPKLENTIQGSKPEYVPGEIYVKFNRQTAEKLRQRLYNNKNLSINIKEMNHKRLQLNRNLVRLNKRYRMYRKHISKSAFNRVRARLYMRYRNYNILNTRLDNLNLVYGVTEIQPVFKTIYRKLQSFGGDIQSIIQETKDRFPERTNRAPKDFERPKIEDIFLIKFNKNIDIIEIIKKYQNDPDVLYAEPRGIIKFHMVPDDPYYLPKSDCADPSDYLWGIKKLDCEQAWDISQGEGVVVAVIDTGIDYTHEDLAENIWINTGELPAFFDSNGDNSISYQEYTMNMEDYSNDGKVNFKDFYYSPYKDVIDDENGYENDLIGWDFGDMDNDPMDLDGHGTICAGIIGAAGNNIGIIGVAPKVKIMPIKKYTDEGTPNIFQAVWPDSIYYAVDNGADVLSCSWGSSSPQVYKDAFDYAYYQGALVVHSAGNGNKKLYNPLNKNVMTVAAIDCYENKASFSNYGKNIDISAPGKIILSTLSDNSIMAEKAKFISPGYYCTSGTSNACPHVAGVAALIVSHYNSSLPLYNIDVDGIKGIIRASAKPFPEDPLVPLGTGIVNAYNALIYEPKPFFRIKGTQIEEIEGDGDKIPESNETINVIIKLENIGSKKASLVTAKLNNTSEYISSTIPTDSIYNLGDFKVGQTKDNSNNPFVLKVENLDDVTPYCITANPALEVFASTDDGLEFEQILNFSIPLRTMMITGNNANPAPDLGLGISGSKIVWTDFRSNNADIYLYNLETKNEKQITIDSSSQRFPAISGNKIVYQVFCDSSKEDLYLYDLDAEKEVPIVTDPHYQTEPDIYGDVIVWKDNRNNLDCSCGVKKTKNTDIYLYDLDAGEELQVTTNASAQKKPAIYGNKIVWEDTQNGNSDIYLYDLYTKQKTQITSNLSSQYCADISNDKIVWEDKNLHYEIFLCDLELGEEIQITKVQNNSCHNKRRNTKPAISGNNVVYLCRNYDSCNNKLIYDKNVHIYLYDLNKKEEIQITDEYFHPTDIAISCNRIVWYDGKYDSICMAEIASAEPQCKNNYLINPSADGGLYGWNIGGTPIAEGTDDPSFLLSSEGDYLWQDIPIPYGATIVHICGKVKCLFQDTQEGFPYLYAYVMEDNYHILKYLTTGTVKSSEWTTVHIDQEINTSAVKIRLFLKRSNKKGCNDINEAYFDDITVTFDCI